MSDKIPFEKAVSLLNANAAAIVQMSFHDVDDRAFVITTNAATAQQLLSRWIDGAPGRAKRADGEVSLLKHAVYPDASSKVKPWKPALSTLRELDGRTHLHTVLSSACKADGTPLETLGDVSEFGAARLLAIRSCGQKTVEAARALLYRYQLNLAA